MAEVEIVRELDGYAGQAWLIRRGSAAHFVVSQIADGTRRPEILIFPANRHGEVMTYHSIGGRYLSRDDAVQAIADGWHLRESFLIKVHGGEQSRLMRVHVLAPFDATDDSWCPVDVRDHDTRMESQAIIAESVIYAGPLALMADSQMRACVRSVYGNATTTWVDGRPEWGPALPDDFGIEVNTPGRWDLAGIDPDRDES